MVQGNHVFNGAAQIWLPFRGEEHAGGTNIPSLSSQSNAIGATAGYVEWELKLETPCSSLFHLD
jgi:hypothetical protein